jgi:ATP-dependent Clp protease protease subunit
MNTPRQMLIPTVIETEGHQERAYDIYSRLLKDRIIFLGDEINEQTSNILVAQLLFLDSQDTSKDIMIYINSPGGSVYDAFAIYDTINHIKSDVQTIVVGMAASAAAFLLSSGTKGKRFALPNSKIMIHQPSSGTRGKVTDMEIVLEESLKLKKQLEQIIADNTGQKVSKVHQDMERDYYMTSHEAKAYGLVDDVIKSRK